MLSLLLITSCVGQKEIGSGYNVTITASQPNINIDEGESVKLRVKNLSIDVTDQAEIYYTANGEEIAVEGGIFTATESGEYSFSARYEGVEANGHAVVRAYNSDELTENFFRRNLVMKFTGTWCVNCPNMGNAIIEVEHAMPNRIVEMAVHSNDQLEVSEGATLVKDYNIFSLPTTLVELYNSTTTPSASGITKLVEEATSTNATSAGVRVATTLSGTSLDVEVGVKSNDQGNYKVAVALVTDNYNYAQTGADDPNYKQDKVLRFYLSAIYGDSVGVIEADSEATVKYEKIAIPAESLNSESRIIAYVISEESGKPVVINATECVIGDSIDYIYEIE